MRQSFGFVFNNNDPKLQFKAQKNLKPGTSRDVERALDFIKKHPEFLYQGKILEIFSQATSIRDTTVTPNI